MGFRVVIGEEEETEVTQHNVGMAMGLCERETVCGRDEEVSGINESQMPNDALAR